MNALRHFLEDKEDIKSILDGIASGLKEQFIAGLTGSARSMFISAVDHTKQQKKLIVTHQLTHAQQLYDDLVEFSDNPNIYLYPVNELIAAEMAIASPELRVMRIKSLMNWLESEQGILIAPVSALKRMLPPKSYWQDYQLSFSEGKSIPVEQTLLHLVDMGYERTDMVTAPSEFSVRGGIIDIYPASESSPVRMELFDDEIDSIRYFDADTQRSLDGKLSEITIRPAKELLLTKEDSFRAAERIEKHLAKALHKMKSSDVKKRSL